jgi:ribosomal protein S6--L-glutamate ligase
MLCFLTDDSFSPVTSPVLVTVIDILARHGFHVETFIAEEVDARPEFLGSIHDLYIIVSNTEASLSLAGILHTQGARMLNPYMGCIITQDKIVASRLLYAAGVPVPSSWVTRNLTLLRPIVEQTPLVIIPHRRYRGAGARLIQNADELALIPPPKTPVLIQKFVQGNGEDLKIYVVNEEVFAIRKRVPPLRFIPQTEKLSQLGEPCEVSAEVRDIALRCGRILGLGLYGVDVIETSEGPFVVDVNSFPSYQGVPNIAPLIADYIRGYALGRFNLEPLGLNAQAETELTEEETKDSGTAVEEAIFLTEFLQTSATIRWDPERGADSKAKKTTQEAQPVRIHYAHTMPEHAPELTGEGKWHQVPKKGVAYERPRSQYDSQYLRENGERLTERFLNALRNPDDALNPAAQHGLHVFAETMAQTEGASLSQAASEHNLPFSSLAGWVRRRLVPILYRDKHTVYLAKETVQNVADLHQKAKEQGTPTGKLLREMQKRQVP